MELSFLGLINMLYSRYSNQLLKDAIKGILLFQEEQIKQLELLSSDLTTLKQGPIFSAYIFLNDAARNIEIKKSARVN
ncbi:hypothetical protein [Neobacillus mesonae]|uniref:hypothetical protein n=1 Tax=Neobacillus mesonae TaxID=1193713 RepID=UPI00203CF63C|nr:hypothetical protein [Neobacillus mesonae]MCM3571068.1 hypothetical protein [Neobacillus mesonae]